MRGFLVILLYLAAVAASAHAAGRDSSRIALREPALYLAAGAVLAHAFWLANTLLPLGKVAMGIPDSASLMGLVVGAGGIIALLSAGYRTVAAVVLGIAALLAAGTGSLPEPRDITETGWPLAVHILLALGSAGMFAIAAVLVIVLAVQDGQLRSKRPAKWLTSLPPVESLEHAMFTVIGTGMAALTMAILAGLLFVTNLFQQHLAHKTILALAAWLIFAVLLVGRWRFGWRGRKAAAYTITGFIVLALAY
ncbi:MAG: cytochrome c biogenesis protein CcsA, partial [Steroidobacteraceae bacterium]